MKPASGTPETKVIVSGSFARAMKALASFARNRYTLTYDITSEWFNEGPPVQYAQYHIETLKPYVENHVASED